MTLGSAYNGYIKKCTKEFIKQYKSKWMNGNDGWYYFITEKSSETIFALKSDSKKIIDLIRITVEEASSFEEVNDGDFKCELDALLCKAYLTGVYVEKKIVTGWYKWKTKMVNIMEE